jgi:hypothetical protein
MEVIINIYSFTKDKIGEEPTLKLVIAPTLEAAFSVVDPEEGWDIDSSTIWGKYKGKYTKPTVLVTGY